MITSRTTSKNFSLLTLTFTFLFLLSSCSASQTDSIVGNWSSSLYFHNNEWVDDDSVFCQINNGGNAFLKFSFDNKDDEPLSFYWTYDQAWTEEEQKNQSISGRLYTLWLTEEQTSPLGWALLDDNSLLMDFQLSQGQSMRWAFNRAS